ncbi:hypothetical protein P3F83_06370 [Mycobacteroides immunogenum]|uniref:hypothetical protein n=1 Tax=Mycobacteroides immunogenum TaxID=83262 RepID=UPI0025B79F14|nr:hypothetical protein [Mycobacteroides immunogenum]WJR35004.1 hypothetical protein P3F83_06370 [Mycobacteroides immunogenum]
MVEKADYEGTLSLFKSKKDECGDLKEKAHSAFKILRNIISGIGFVGFLTAEWLDTKESEVTEHIEDLLKKLDEVMKGADAPNTFIDYSYAWKNQVQNHVKDASDTVSQDTTFGGYWTGSAAGKYGEARNLQVSALGANYEMNNQVSQKLMDLADSGWNFYKDLIQALSGFLTKVTGAIGKIAAVITAPWGVSDTIDCLTGVIDLVTQIETSKESALREQYKAKLELDSMPSITRGMPGGHWPVATTDRYNDASVTDGTNDWSVESDVNKS